MRGACVASRSRTRFRPSPRYYWRSLSWALWRWPRGAILHGSAVARSSRWGRLRRRAPASWPGPSCRAPLRLFSFWAHSQRSSSSSNRRLRCGSVMRSAASACATAVSVSPVIAASVGMCAIAGWLAATSQELALVALAVVLVSLAFRRPIVLVVSFAASALLSEWFLAADRAGFLRTPSPASSVATWSIVLGLAAVFVGQRRAHEPIFGNRVTRGVRVFVIGTIFSAAV